MKRQERSLYSQFDSGMGTPIKRDLLYEGIDSAYCTSGTSMMKGRFWNSGGSSLASVTNTRTVSTTWKRQGNNLWTTHTNCANWDLFKGYFIFFSKRIINWKWSETDHFITLHCFSSTSEFCKFSAVYLLSLHLFHNLFTLFMFVFFFSFHWFLFYSTDRLQKSYSHNCKIP